jgi:D-amino-acid dehydrogenase
MKIAVLGGGVIGVTTAFFLGKQGHEVTLIEAEAEVAQKTSFANGAQLSYGYTEPLASPAIIPKLPQLISGRDAAFRIKPALDSRLLSWGTQFLKNCTARRESQNTQAVLNLALRSRDALQQLLKEHPIAFDHRQAAKLHVYTQDKAFQAAIKKAQLKTDWGYLQEILTPEQCLAKEPGLNRYSNHIAGGIYSPQDEVGDPYRFSVALREICQTEFHATFLLNTRIEQLVRHGNRIKQVETTRGVIEADAYVLALGPQSAQLVKTAGITLPIYPIKGYSITVPATDQAPQVSITDTDHKMVYCTLGDKLRIAGIADMVGDNETTDPRRIEQLIRTAQQRFPQAGDYSRILHQWSGLRPATPNSIPLIGRSTLENLFLNTGHGMLGWTLACGSGAVIAALVEDIEPQCEGTFGRRSEPKRETLIIGRFYKGNENNKS